MNDIKEFAHYVFLQESYGFRFLIKFFIHFKLTLAIPKNAQTTTQLHSSHMLVK